MEIPGQKQKNRLEHKIGLNISASKQKEDNTSAAMLHKLSLPELSAKILELAENKERITISDIIKATNANINTIKKHLSELVKQNYLIKHGKTRGAWYVKK